MDQNAPLRAPSTRILTIPEAIEALRIGKSSFYKLTSSGQIRTLRLGGRTLVPEREIERLINSAVTEEAEKKKK